MKEIQDVDNMTENDNVRKEEDNIDENQKSDEAAEVKEFNREENQQTE